MKSKFFAGILTTVITLMPLTGALANNDIVDPSDNQVDTKFTVNGGYLTWGFDNEEISFTDESNSQLTIGEITGTQTLPVERTSKFKDITVNDERGSLEGYNISVKATKFTSEQGKVLEHQLNDTFLSFGAGTIDFTKSDEESEKNVEFEGIDKIENEDLTFVNVPNGSGYGELVYTFGDDTLKLNIHQKNVKNQTYSSTVTFTLKNGPNSN